MTRDEAIDRLENMAWIRTNDERREDIQEAIDMAIEALSAEPSGDKGGDAEMSPLQKPTTTPMQQSPSDGAELISREAVKAKACEFFGHEVVFVNRIDALPSADRPTGNWISEVDTGIWFLKCSECGCRVQEEQYRIAVGTAATKCPYCGAELGLGGYTYDDYADRPSQRGDTND